MKEKKGGLNRLIDSVCGKPPFFYFINLSNVSGKCKTELNEDDQTPKRGQENDQATVSGNAK